MAAAAAAAAVAAACLRTVTESYSLKSLPGSHYNKTIFNINLSMLYDIRLLCQPLARSESPKQTLRDSDNSWMPKCGRLWLIDFPLLNYFFTYLLTHSLTHLLTHTRSLTHSRNRVLLEKLTGFQLVKKFLAFYGTQRLITAFTSACHPSLS